MSRSFAQRRHCHSTSREDLVAALRTLGITTLSSGGGFTQAEIKKKYYALAKAHHPDTKSDKTKSSSSSSPSSQVKGPDMSVVNDAHATITAYFKSGGSAAGLKAALQSSSSSGGAGRGGASAGHPHQYSYSDFVYGADSQGYSHGGPFPGHPFGSGGGGPYDDYESSFFAGYSGPDYHQFYSNGPGGASNTSSSSSQQQHAGGPGQGPHNTYQDPFGGQNPHDFGAGTGTGGFWDGFAEYGYGGPGGDFDNEPPPFEFVTEEDFIRYGGFTADGPGGPSGAEAFAEFFSDRGGRGGGRRGGRGGRAGRGRGHDFQSQTAQHVYGSWRDVDADELRRNGRNGGAGSPGGGYKSYGPSGDAPGSGGPYDPWPQDYESGQVDESGMPYGGDSQRGGHRGREMDGRHFVVEDENGETFVFTQGPNGGPRMYGPDGVCEDIPWEALHDDIREAYVYSQQQHSPGGNRSQRQHSKKKDGVGSRKRRQEKREQQNRQSQNQQGQSAKTSDEARGSSNASGMSSATESSGGKKSEGDRRLSGFTDVEVEALQHMHRDGKSFKFISEAMERPLNEILEAFNALNAQQATTGASSDQQKQKGSTNQTSHGAGGGDNKNHRRDGNGGGKNHRHTTGGQSHPHGRSHPQRPVGSVKTGHSAHGPGGRPQYTSTQDPTAASMADEFYGDFDGHQQSSRPAPHHKKQHHHHQHGKHQQRYHNKGKQGDMHVDGIPVSFVELDDNGQPIRPRNKPRHQNQTSSGNHNNKNNKKQRHHSSHGTRGPAHDFFAALAFRCFYSTQYIRHHSKPLYTPEPDCVHELMGHVPLLADPAFANFSQQFGLLSLGASDEAIEKLGHCYWYSVEFGLCTEGGGNRAYGAGLLSSFGELEYALTDKPKFGAWDPFKASVQDYPITTYQPHYFVAESFEDAQKKLLEFGDTLDSPFRLQYNQSSRSIKTFSKAPEILARNPIR